MKITFKLLTIILPTLFIISCSGGGDGEDKACASSPLLGTWSDPISGGGLTFDSTCSGTVNLCESTFTYPSTSATSGEILIEITSAANPSVCLPVGNYICDYAIQNDQLAYDCGTGPVLLDKAE